MGIACCVLMGGFGPSRQALSAGMRYGGYETAVVRMDADGRATVFTGLPTQGQGLDGALAQICAARLGLDPAEDVRVVAGDTAVTPYSPVGPIASRGVAVGGSAVRRAADKVAGDLERAASIMLEAPPSLVELTGRRAVVRGAPGEGLPLAAIASAVKQGRFGDHGVDPALEAVCSFEPPDQTYSFAVHVARVRLDADTGLVTVQRYHAISDCGTLINPAVVEGQIVGGIVQGIGGALTEEAAYSPEGQPLATTPMDYLVPTAVEAPHVEAEFAETPTSRTATGARGAGELGIIGPAAAIAGAVADALGPGLPAPARTPMTPERVWRLLSAPGRPSEPPLT
jgi:carbon-monoxide dehydrogenase large subunit